MARAAIDGAPFSISYRRNASDGVERKVLLVCEGGFREGVGRDVTAINGYYVDLTEDFRQESEKLAQEAVTESARHRATIERAVGCLMLAYGLDAEQAFDLLRWWSQNKNVKVRDLAKRLGDAASAGATSDVGMRKTFDVLLHDLPAEEAPTS
ncbi:ANTAR domain-containing protein [Nocardioides sp. LHG3406-4]|uniref:ANTAR domain-containing protein n=1 Tax=Nocardioides sp. LHG3406-4 TaxID=2804575 RepID=UPI003CF49C2F